MADSNAVQGFAVAGGTLASAILDALVQKNILTRAEARAVVDDAARQLRGLSTDPSVSAAADILVTLGRQYANHRS